MRGGAEVGAGQTEVAVLGGGEVVSALRRADGEARGLAQLEVEALRGVRVARDRLAVRVPVLAVLSFEVDSALGSADDLNGLVVGLVALQSHALGAHEALLALQHQDRSVNKIEVVFAVVVDGVGVGVQMSGALGHQVLAVVGAERHGAVALPLQLEQGIR